MTMTPHRVLLLLFTGVLAIGGALWLSTSHEPRDEAGASIRVLPGLQSQINDVTTIGLVAADGNEVHLERNDGIWVVRERSYPADMARLRTLLLDMARLSVIEAKTSDPAKYAQLGVADEPAAGSGTVRITLGMPKEDRELIVGKASGGTGVHVRVPGQESAMLAAPPLRVEADPRRWIDTKLLAIEPAQVRSMEVSPAAGPAYVASRGDAKDPLTLRDLPKGMRQATPDIVTPIASALEALEAIDVAPAKVPEPGTAGEKSTARLRVLTFSGLAIDIVGREAGERRYIIIGAEGSTEATKGEAAALQRQFAGREFEIARYRYDGLFRPLADFTGS